MLIARPEHTKQDLLRITTLQVIDFCELNNLPIPKIKIIVCRNYGFFQPNAQGGYIGINLPATRLPVFNPVNGRLQSFPGNKTDRTPAGVLAHEVGHYVDINNRAKFNLASEFRALIGVENSVSSYDTIEVERVAEAFRLFILNPKLLQQGRPKAYTILQKHFKPVHQLPWRLAFHYTKAKATYIDWCEKWIDKKNVITKEAKVMRYLIDSHPNSAPRYIVGA
jgi:hypothetical protein